MENLDALMKVVSLKADKIEYLIDFIYERNRKLLLEDVKVKFFRNGSYFCHYLEFRELSISIIPSEDETKTYLVVLSDEEVLGNYTDEEVLLILNKMLSYINEERSLQNTPINFNEAFDVFRLDGVLETNQNVLNKKIEDLWLSI